MGHRRKRHPVQPVEWDGKGVLRFKKNPLVEHLLNKGGIDLNRLATAANRDKVIATVYDWDQFFMLIGYPVSGCPLKSKLNKFDTDEKVMAYRRKFPNDPDLATETVRQEPPTGGGLARRALMVLSEEERLEVLHSFCRGCGSDDPSCQCQNDE